MRFEYYTKEIDEISSLIKEAFSIDIKSSNLNLQNNQRILLLKEENVVVGLSLLTLKIDPFKNKKTYYVDYLCIREKYQHQSLGRKMFEEIIRLAKENGVNRIELTSRKEREKARKIYLDYGMTIKDTDLFELEI